jgi:hypothetical protein
MLVAANSAPPRHSRNPPPRFFPLSPVEIHSLLDAFRLLTFCVQKRRYLQATRCFIETDSALICDNFINLPVFLELRVFVAVLHLYCCFSAAVILVLFCLFSVSFLWFYIVFVLLVFLFCFIIDTCAGKVARNKYLLNSVELQGGSNMTGTDLCVNKSQFVPVIFEPPCIIYCFGQKNA